MMERTRGPGYRPSQVILQPGVHREHRMDHNRRRATRTAERACQGGRAQSSRLRMRAFTTWRDTVGLEPRAKLFYELTVVQYTRTVFFFFTLYSLFRIRICRVRCRRMGGEGVESLHVMLACASTTPKSRRSQYTSVHGRSSLTRSEP